jgi:hypothetical protein
MASAKPEPDFERLIVMASAEPKPDFDRLGGRYWARTSDPQLVELVLSQLS